MIYVLVALLLLVVAIPSYAKSYNPDGRTSLTLTAGVGTGEGWFHDGDITAFAATLNYPMNDDFSFLAKAEHSEIDWHANWFPNLKTTVYTAGLRIFF